MPWGLYALTIGSFGIGITEFVIMGLLKQVGESLSVSIEAAGLLISGYALGVVFGAPLLTIASATWSRRNILISLMVIFIIGNIGCAMAPTYSLLMIARIITAFAHGTYFGVGSVVAADMVPKDKKSSAISIMFAGLTFANVIGVPFGTWLGLNYGWRSTFWAVSSIGFIAFIILYLAIPKSENAPDAMDWREDVQVIKRLPVILSLLTTVLVDIGVFAVFTYIEPILTTITHIQEEYVAPILLLFGVGLVIGNIIGGKCADKNLNKTLFGSIFFLIITLITMSFTIYSPIPAIISVGVLGIAMFAVVSPLQSCVLEYAQGAGQSLASSMNIGAFNLGNALGAALGAGIIDIGYGYYTIPIIATFMPILAIFTACLNIKLHSPKKI